MYFSRGLIIETKSWLQKAKNRSLITENKFEDLFKQLETIHVKLNAYMKFIGKNPASPNTNELMNQWTNEPKNEDSSLRATF